MMADNGIPYANFVELLLGERLSSDGGRVLMLERDEKGFYIREFYFIRARFDTMEIGKKYLAPGFPQNTSFDQFMKHLKRNYPQYELSKNLKEYFHGVFATPKA